MRKGILSALRRELDAMRKQVVTADQPCIMFVERCIAESGEIVWIHAGTGELYPAAPREDSAHRCTDACLVIGWSIIGPAPEDPEFRRKAPKWIRDTMASRARGARSGGAQDYDRKHLEDWRRACAFYGIPYPQEAAAFLDALDVPEPAGATEEAVVDSEPQPEPPRAPPPVHGPARDATVEVRPARPLLAAPQLSGAMCVRCRCPVERHEAWTNPARWRCVLPGCGFTAEGHVRPPHLDGGTQPCGSYRGYGAVNADTCECGRCGGLALPRPLELTVTLGRNRMPESVEEAG